MTVADIIERKLAEELEPVELSVIDESHKHAGHVGARPEGETHFRVEIISEKFTGLSRVESHQLVYEILSEEMDNPIHALAIKAKSPKIFE